MSIYAYALDSKAILETARGRAGLSLRALAKRAGVPVSTVLRVEQGRMAPTVDMLNRLVGAAGYELVLDLAPKPALVDESWIDVARRLVEGGLPMAVLEGEGRILGPWEAAGWVTVEDGQVTSFDTAAVVRDAAERGPLLRRRGVTTWVVPGGPREFMRRIQSAAPAGDWAITGSLAAERIAAVTAPAYAVAYVEDPDATAKALGLLPAETGANVALLPASAARLRGSVEGSGLRWASVAQVAIDCLGGNGRMPAEGEALLRLITTG